DGIRAFHVTEFRRVLFRSAGTPVMTALFSAWAGHERLGPRVWLGVGGAVVGMALIVASGGGEMGFGGETLAGDLIMVAASLAWRSEERRVGKVDRGGGRRG